VAGLEEEGLRHLALAADRDVRRLTAERQRLDAEAGPVEVLLDQPAAVHLADRRRVVAARGGVELGEPAVELVLGVEADGEQARDAGARLQHARGSHVADGLGDVGDLRHDAAAADRHAVPLEAAHHQLLVAADGGGLRVDSRHAVALDERGLGAQARLTAVHDTLDVVEVGGGGEYLVGVGRVGGYPRVDARRVVRIAWRHQGDAHAQRLRESIDVAAPGVSARIQK
jgi:hypothetical protein